MIYQQCSHKLIGLQDFKWWQLVLLPPRKLGIFQSADRIFYRKHSKIVALRYWYILHIQSCCINTYESNYKYDKNTPLFCLSLPLALAIVLYRQLCNRILYQGGWAREISSCDNVHTDLWNSNLKIRLCRSLIVLPCKLKEIYYAHVTVYTFKVSIYEFSNQISKPVCIQVLKTEKTKRIKAFLVKKKICKFHHKLYRS